MKKRELKKEVIANEAAAWDMRNLMFVRENDPILGTGKEKVKYFNIAKKSKYNNLSDSQLITKYDSTMAQYHNSMAAYNNYGKKNLYNYTARDAILGDVQEIGRDLLGAGIHYTVGNKNTHGHDITFTGSLKGLKSIFGKADKANGIVYKKVK